MSISKNPYTGEILRQFRVASQSELQMSLQRAQEAFSSWKRLRASERSALFIRVAEILLADKHTYAKTITLEMGKPITQALAEVEKCAWVCRHYAEQAAAYLKPRHIETGAKQSYVRYDPLGAVLAVMPWNYPFWQVFRFAAPALSAGNVGLLKHAPNVWKCSQHIQQIFDHAGFPTGVFQSLKIEEDRVSLLLESDVVRGLILTGSTHAGSAVASLSGKNLKRTVLELGGNNAVVVFPDADLDHALNICIEARFQNTGQSCIAGKRLLLHKEIARPFIDNLISRVRELNCGNPLEADTYIGVLAREDLAEKLDNQMRGSLKLGAVLGCGGCRKGTFFEPTVLLEVTDQMPVFTEETFGPLLAVTIFESEEEALTLINKSRYGLGVSIFTKDSSRIERLIPQLDEGSVFVNSMVKSDPRLPFGGVKDSGYGRELSAEGIYEFTNIKTVYIQ